MAVSLSGMKEYGYATDGTWQEGTAKLCLDAAKQYVKNAGVPDPADGETNSLYELAVYMLAMNWYDNRETQIIGTVKETLAHGLNSIILQLR